MCNFSHIGGWIFRLDPDSGEVIWDRTLYDYRSPIYDMGFWDGVELADGDLVFTGLYQDTFPNAMPFINDPNVWLVRLSAQGRAMKTETFYAGSPQQFDWGDLLPGMYYYLIRTDAGGAQSGKLVIVR
ncbi:MAG: hypothetical protein SH848_01175 [Saprospiraceae bacterium]|nr:hypothetical protein [Saprospiraceae bacterium]MDZ4702507.1 hypothetical protein [Saprospiraceae bacterium]